MPKIRKINDVNETGMLTAVATISDKDFNQKEIIKYDFLLVKIVLCAIMYV